MREQDAVYLTILPLYLLLYIVMSSRFLPLVVPSARGIPKFIQKFIAAGFRQQAFTPRGAVARYIGWTAFTQVVPLLIVWSGTEVPAIRIASGLELAASAAWTGYLLISN